MALGDLIQQPTEQGTQDESTTQTKPSVYTYGSVEEYAASRDETYVPPVEAYNPYAEGTPQNVIDAYSALSTAQTATQDYADEWQTRIINDYNGYATDPNYKGTLTKDETDAVYGYLSDKQKTTDYTAWTAPNPSDYLFSTILPNWESANKLTTMAEAELNGTAEPTQEDQIVQSIYDQTTNQAQRDFLNAQNLEHLDWNMQSTSDKWKYLLMPGSGADPLEGAPWYAKYIQNIAPSAMAAGAGAMLGSLIPIPGAGLIGGAIVGGLTYLQGVTDLEVPILNDILGAIDMPSVWTEQGQGALGAAMTKAGQQQGVDLGSAPLIGALKNAVGGNLDIVDLAKTTADILQDPQYKYLWNVSKYSYEVSADWGMDNVTLAARNKIAELSDKYLDTDIGQREMSDISRANIGRGMESVVEGSQDYASLIDVYLPIYTAMVENYTASGMTEKQAIEMTDAFFEQNMLNYMGTSGLGRDLLASSIADPENLIPYTSGKTAEGIGKSMESQGKASGNTALQKSGQALQSAGKAAVGNPLIDLLPPVVQQIAEGGLSVFKKNPNAPDLLKTFGSQGFDIIKQTYAKNLQGTVPVDSLTWVQRQIADVNESGTLKGYDAIDKKKWFSNLFQTTAETRMLNLSQMTTDFLGSVMFDGRISPEQLPAIVMQAVGKLEIDDTSPLAPYRNTAVLNTIQEGWSGIKDNASILTNIQTDVDNFRKYNPQRAVLADVAKQMNMSEREIIDALQPKSLDDNRKMTKRERKQLQDAPRQELFKQIRDAGITYTDPTTGKVMDTEQVIKSVNAFHNHSRMYSMTYFKADVMDRLGRISDEYNLKKYNIQPDSWAMRLSELTKSIQSISLLNFSSSYMVNNFLNNMLTRGAVGVGGFDMDYIKTANDLRGLQFSRNEKNPDGTQTIYGNTKGEIGKAKKANDALAKIDKLYRNATDEKHIVGKILKGVNNLSIEDWEKKAAFQIGTSRYWDATWGSNIPDMPDVWKTAGITDDMQNRIYKLALDSPNIDTFSSKLMGEVVIPGARSTFDDMVKNNYSDEAAKIIRDRFSCMPQVFDYMDRYLESGDVATINKAFDRLQDQITSDIQFKNVIQQLGEFDDLKVRYSFEGFSAVGTAMEAIGDIYSDVWIDSTKQNGTLFLDRVVQNIPEEQFRKMYESRHAIQQADYNIARGYAIKNIGAMIAGLGLESDFSKALLLNVMKQFDLSEQYWNTEHELNMTYAQKNSKDYDIKYYKQAKLDALKNVLSIQLDATKEMDAMLVKYLLDNCDPSYAGNIDAYEKILQQIEQKKEKYNAQQLKDAEKRIDAASKKKRQTISHKQEAPRIDMKREITNLHTQAAQLFKALDNTFQNPQINIHPLTLDEALRLEMFYEEAKRTTKNHGEFLDHYVDKSNPKSQFEPVNFDNSKVKTSFREYADSQIMAQAQNGPIARNYSDLKMEYVNRFHSGDAVPLGASPDVYGNMPNTGLQIGTEYKLINPKTDFSASEFMMARTQPFYYDGNMVNAGVYRNGNLIGYIVEGMPETVTVEGKTFPVIGISKTDPGTYLLLVDDKVWRVNPQSPKNYDYSYFAKENFHPGSPGSTPTIEQTGKAALETSPAIREAIRLWKEQAIADLQDARSNGSLFSQLNNAQREAVFQWMDNDLRQAYSSQRFQTQRYGETMVDASLLNYSQRYGFDNMLTMIMPYQFWMTRSMANWAKRMVSQPAWFSMYSRLEKLIEKNKKDFLPSRLNGLVGMLMPNMGDGLGSSIYMDVANIVLPFKQFYDTGEYFIKNLKNVHQNTLREIDKMYENGEITLDEYNEAREGRGELYQTVFEEQRQKDEADVSLGGLMENFLSPSVPVQAILKHLRGKDKDISYTPAYQLGTTIKAVGDDTPFEGITDFLGNAVQYPETQLRKLLGLDSDPYGSNYTEYYIDTYIANMYTDKEISYYEAAQAIADGPGNKIYDEAAHRFLMQQGIRKQGGAIAEELGQWIGGNKDTSVGQIAGSAVASIFGGKVLPQGEQEYRKITDLYHQIVNSGNEEAYKQFWKEYPDFKVHRWANEDDPEEKLHNILVDMVSNTYYALPHSQQIAVQQGLGERFEYYFLNKETKATDMIPDDELVSWIRAMNGEIPQFSKEELNAPMQQAQQIKWYADSIEGRYQRYKNTIKQMFPGIDTIEEGYYNLSNSTQKKNYLKQNPSLEKYWDYKDNIRRSDPDLGTFIMQRSAHYSANIYHNYDTVTQAIMNNVNDYAVEKIENYINYGWKIPAETESKLRTVFAALGITNMTYDQWKKSLVSKKSK